MRSTHTAVIPFPHVPAAACAAHVFDNLACGSLFSIPLLCQHGCDVTINHDTQAVVVTHDGREVFTGSRSPVSDLWVASITIPSAVPSPSACAVIGLDAPTAAERVAYYHAACGSPSLSTWYEALDRGHFVTWPGLDAATARRHPPRSWAEKVGHLDQERKNQRSSKQTQLGKEPSSRSAALPAPNHNTTGEESSDDRHPSAGDGPAPRRERFIWANCATMTGQQYMDATGRFLVPSTVGNLYMLVIYDEDSNSIHVEVMKDRSSAQYVAAFDRAFKHFSAAGFRPRLQRLDNEASHALLQYMDVHEVGYQFVPPYIHRQNRAERAIRTFQRHFKSILATTHKDFPLRLWDQLIPQAVCTLNLLRSSRVNPRLSAYAQIYGAFDFSRTPLAPLGTRVLVHVKPDQRGTWEPHGKPGYYVGTAMKHHRCYRCYVSETQTTRVTDTVAWFPEGVRMPSATAAEAALAAARDLIAALRQPAPAAPVAPLDRTHTAALQQLADIFAATVTPQPPIALHDGGPPARLGEQPVQLPRVPTQATVEQDALLPPIPPPVAATAPAPLPRVPATAPAPLPRVPAAAEAPLPAPAAVTEEDTYITVISRRGQRSRTKTAKAAQLAAQAEADATRRQPARSTTPTNATTKGRSAPRKQRSRPVAAQQQPQLPAPPAAAAMSILRRPPRTVRFSDEPPQVRLLPADEALADDIPNATPQPTTGQPRRGTDPSASCAAADDAANAQPLRYSALCKGVDGKEWRFAATEEFSRLLDGVPGRADLPAGTNTMGFIAVGQLPAGRRVTYARFVCARKIKEGKLRRRVRLTVGGDQLDYDGDTAAHVASIPTVKCLLNSVLAEPKAKFMCVDIKNFYLGTPMETAEYMRINAKDVPEDIMVAYKLAALVDDRGFLLVEIRKGMYGLAQAGILAQQRLVAHLATEGYHQAANTPALFRHVTNGNTFTLIVDDFGVKYFDDTAAEHLLAALRKLYEITVDWTGSLYIGITLDWDYDGRRTGQRSCTLSMPGYVRKALARFNADMAPPATHSPSAYERPTYGSHPQLTDAPDDSTPLDPPAVLRLRQIVGTFLYYACALDCTMRLALSQLAAAQSKATAATDAACRQFLAYAATYPEVSVRYTASDMVLHVHSDASYLSEPDARSRAGGLFYLTARPRDPTVAPTPDSTPLPMNGPVLVLSSILPGVMASAAEAEYGALFINGKEAVALRNTLTDLGHPQPATPIQTDNSCAAGLANRTVKQRRSKAIDMRFHWVRDRVGQGQFLVYWRKGLDNMADFFTKRHPHEYHRLKRRQYVRDVRRTP
jgi:hypothetical protein